MVGKKDVECVENPSTLMTIINLLVFCLGTASLTHFVMKCQEHGMIFRSYRYIITVYLLRKGYKNLFKALGGCIYCFGTWVFIVLFLFWYRENNFIIGLFLGTGFNYLFIESILKLKH